jgi:hypothetical protein
MMGLNPDPRLSSIRGRIAMLTLFTDGGSRGNPGPSAIGGVGFEEGREVFRFSERSPDGTNNEAEYRALLRGLRLAQEYGYSDVQSGLYYRLLPSTLVGEKYLCVVTKTTNDDAFVLTAYLTDAIKSGVTVWPRST